MLFITEPSVGLSVVALLTIKHDKITSKLMPPYERQASWPKAAGSKLPTLQGHQVEGESSSQPSSWSLGMAWTIVQVVMFLKS